MTHNQSKNGIKFDFFIPPLTHIRIWSIKNILLWVDLARYQSCIHFIFIEITYLFWEASILSIIGVSLQWHRIRRKRHKIRFFPPPIDPYEISTIKKIFLLWLLDGNDQLIWSGQISITKKCYFEIPYTAMYTRESWLDFWFAAICYSIPLRTGYNCDLASGWLPYGGACYFVSSSPELTSSNWFQARRYCLQQGGELASVHSDNERKFIIGLVNRYRRETNNVQAAAGVL